MIQLQDFYALLHSFDALHKSAKLFDKIGMSAAQSIMQHVRLYL